MWWVRSQDARLPYAGDWLAECRLIERRQQQLLLQQPTNTRRVITIEIERVGYSRTRIEGVVMNKICWLQDDVLSSQASAQSMSAASS
jgi:hypothetical protein